MHNEHCKSIGQGWWVQARRAAASVAFAILGLAPLDARASGPDVSLLVEGPGGPLTPGAGLVYKLHVANKSLTTPTPKLVVEANIPQYMAVNRPPDGKCAPKRCDSTYMARFGGTVRWNVPPLAPGAASVHELRSVIDNSAEYPPPPDGSVVPLDASVKSGEVKVASATSTVVIQVAAPSLGLAITGTTRTEAGNALDYTFRFGNVGLSPASATLRVPLPPRTSVLLASKGAVMAGDALEWDLGKLPAGFSDQRSVRLFLDARAPVATLFAIKAELRSSTQKTAGYAELATLVGKPVPLAITTNVGPDPASPGGVVLYKIDVTNKSPNAPTGAFILQSSIPRDASVNRPQGGKCSPIRCDSSYRARYGSNIFWKLRSLAPGATTSVQFAAVVDKPADAAPPPNGTLLSNELRTHVDGVVRVPLSVAVGTLALVGKGAVLVALEEPKPEPAKREERPKSADSGKAAATPTNETKKTASPAPTPAASPKPAKSGLSVSVTGKLDVKTK